jgi:hypothetical protein
MDFQFSADRPSLDYVVTVAERCTTDLEHLRSAGDLARWIEESASSRLAASEQ